MEVWAWNFSFTAEGYCHQIWWGQGGGVLKSVEGIMGVAYGVV